MFEDDVVSQDSYYSRREDDVLSLSQLDTQHAPRRSLKATLKSIPTDLPGGTRFEQKLNKSVSQAERRRRKDKLDRRRKRTTGLQASRRRRGGGKRIVSTEDRNMASTANIPYTTGTQIPKQTPAWREKLYEYESTLSRSAVTIPKAGRTPGGKAGRRRSQLLAFRSPPTPGPGAYGPPKSTLASPSTAPSIPRAPQSSHAAFKWL